MGKTYSNEHTQEKSDIFFSYKYNKSICSTWYAAPQSKSDVLHHGNVILSVESGGNIYIYFSHFLWPNLLLFAGNEDCPDEGSNLRNYMYVFITGQVLHGIGGAALHTLSLPYLDENIRTTNTPLYVGM